MRYLLHYPMIHLDSLTRTTNKFRMEFKNLGLERSISEEMLREIPRVKDDIDKKWIDFKQYLQKNEPFNRIYFESTTKRKKHYYITNEEDSGMKECLNYLNTTGTIFEVTESNLWYTLARKFQNYPRILSLLDRKRELVTFTNIRKTLKDGERGLLLFGWLHDFSEFFKYSDINYEVYNYNIFSTKTQQI